MKNISIEVWYDATLEMIHFSEIILELVICLQIIEILLPETLFIIVLLHEIDPSHDTPIIDMMLQF